MLLVVVMVEDLFAGAGLDAEDDGVADLGAEVLRSFLRPIYNRKGGWIFQ